MYDAILSRFLSVVASMLLFPLPSGINPIRELLPGHRASRKWILIQGIPILGIQSRISIRPGKATVGFVPTTLRTHFRTSVRGIKGNPYSFMRCTAIWYRMYSTFGYVYFFVRIFWKCIRKSTHIRKLLGSTYGCFVENVHGQLRTISRRVENPCVPCVCGDWKAPFDLSSTESLESPHENMRETSKWKNSIKQLFDGTFLHSLRKIPLATRRTLNRGLFVFNADAKTTLQDVMQE